MSGVHMWDNDSLDIRWLSCESTKETQFSSSLLVPWSTSNVLMRISPDDDWQPLTNYLHQVGAEHLLSQRNADIFSASHCHRSASTAKESAAIQPVVTHKNWEPAEAAGAEFLGTTGLILLAIILTLVIVSDIRYFERVLPIFKRNFMIGVYRIKQAIYRPNIALGMTQLISLTIRLGRDEKTHNDRETLNRQNKKEKVDQNSGNLSSLPPMSSNCTYDVEQRMVDSREGVEQMALTATTNFSEDEEVFLCVNNTHV